MASKEELEQIEDHCAICWEGLRSARKLPCGHFFHQYENSLLSLFNLAFAQNFFYI